VKGMKNVVIGMAATLALSCGIGRSAYAFHGKQGFGFPKSHYKVKRIATSSAESTWRPKSNTARAVTTAVL